MNDCDLIYFWISKNQNLQLINGSNLEYIICVWVYKTTFMDPNVQIIAHIMN